MQAFAIRFCIAARTRKIPPARTGAVLNTLPLPLSYKAKRGAANCRPAQKSAVCYSVTLCPAITSPRKTVELKYPSSYIAFSVVFVSTAACVAKKQTV